MVSDKELYKLILLWSLATTSMWLISFVSIKINYKNRVNQWLSIFTFFCGIGSSCFILEYIANFFVQSKHEMYLKLNYISDILSGIGYYTGPYSLLIFGIAFWEYYSKNYFRYFWHTVMLAALPMLFMYLLIPIHPSTKIHFIMLSSWAAPYCLITTILMYDALSKSADFLTKLQNTIIFLVVALPCNLCMMVSFVFRAIGQDKVYKKFFIVLIFVLIVLIIAFLKFGLLGIRLKIVKQRMESSTKASLEGAQMLNHAIKNEIAKINLAVSNVKKVLDLKNFDSSLIFDDFKILDSSTEHINQLILRIRAQTGEFKVKKSYWNLYQVLTEVVQQNSALLTSKNTKCIINVPTNYQLYFDQLHFIEVLNNLIKNAVEAMFAEGNIELSITRYSNRFALLIKDNGKGMDEETLRYIFEPFYTTKRLNTNFGLGLTYCYNVMAKHSGDIRINSEINAGTKVFLIFPKASLTASKQQDLNNLKLSK